MARANAAQAAAELGSRGEQDWRRQPEEEPAARALVFFMVGIFVLVAAIGNASRARKGLGGAFQVLATHTYGHDLLAIVTIGLFIFGLYSFALARYRA